VLDSIDHFQAHLNVNGSNLTDVELRHVHRNLSAAMAALQGMADRVRSVAAEQRELDAGGAA
jgi:hypothetical protein